MSPQFCSRERTVRHFLNLRSVLVLLTLVPITVFTMYSGNLLVVGVRTACMILLLASLVRQDVLPDLVLSAVLMAIVVAFGCVGNILIIQHVRRTIDALLLRLDGGLSLSFYHWTLNHPAVAYLLAIVYFGIPIVTAISIASAAEPLRAAFTFLVATLIGMVFYGIFPAVGPAHLNAIATAPRNCVPSLHMAWAMLVPWYAHRRIRIPALIFMCLTVAATLGLGEHYIPDLVAAVPLCLFVTYLWDRPKFRARYFRYARFTRGSSPASAQPASPQ